MYLLVTSAKPMLELSRTMEFVSSEVYARISSGFSLHSTDPLKPLPGPSNPNLSSEVRL